MPGVVATDFAANALGGTPPAPGGGPMQAQTAEQVAAASVALIEHPVPEIYTNPTSQDLARRYYQDVAAFETSMGQRR